MKNSAADIWMDRAPIRGAMLRVAGPCVPPSIPPLRPVARCLPRPVAF